MDKNFELKSLVFIVLTGYFFNVLFGILGFTYSYNSYPQLLFFQMGDASAIMASVIAGRYTGLRNQHVAASAFILLGITHGISLAASGVESLNYEKGITIIMSLIPAMILIFWCRIFPIWLRVAGLIPSILFVVVYISVLSGKNYYDWPVKAAYCTWMLVEIGWSVYLIIDWKKEKNKN